MVGILPKKVEPILIALIPRPQYKTYSFFLVAVLFSIVLAYFLIYASTHTGVEGLRNLNTKLTEIFHASRLEDLQVTKDQYFCKEIDELVALFQSLISVKKFN